MKMLNGYIRIKVDPIENQTKSGILLTEDTVKLPQTGTVVDTATSELKVGDRVVFLRYATLDGQDPDERICKLEHIIAKL